MAFSIYPIKPQFQSLLRPMVQLLARIGVSANQVTVFACLLSVALGLGLYHWPVRAAFALVPLWMFLRMALTAVDGMLAREHGQKSKLGAFLNEITEVVAEAALCMPCAVVAPFRALWAGVGVRFDGAFGIGTQRVMLRPDSELGDGCTEIPLFAQVDQRYHIRLVGVDRTGCGVGLGRRSANQRCAGRG